MKEVASFREGEEPMIPELHGDLAAKHELHVGPMSTVFVDFKQVQSAIRRDTIWRRRWQHHTAE
jgi:hypothetical protein